MESPSTLSSLGTQLLQRKKSAKCLVLSDIVPQNTKILLDNHFLFARSSENTWVKPSKLDRTIDCSKSVFDVLDRCPFPCLTRELSPLLF